MDTVRVGNVTISAVSDGIYHFDPHEFFPALSDADWALEPGALGPAGTVDLNIGSFVVRSAGHTILVDTGLGPHGTSPRAESGLLPAALGASAGLREEIDLVVATHVHPDHVGWNMTGTGPDAVPTFPNARYLAPRLDYETGARLPEAEQPKPFREQVAPLERLGRLGLLDGGDALTPQVWVEASPGHTAGHLCVRIVSEGEHAVIVGDLTHIPAQTHRTGWGSRADVDPAQAQESRERVLEAAERSGALYAAGHFPAPGFGRLVRQEGRRYWQALD